MRKARHAARGNLLLIISLRRTVFGQQLAAGQCCESRRPNGVAAAAKKLPSCFVANVISKQWVNLVESHLYPVPSSKRLQVIKCVPSEISEQRYLLSSSSRFIS
jgi:hypothetical protein